MARRTTNGRRGERGFTLAAMIVLMTIMMIVVAYTVPRQWSAVLQRDRERQTIFVMKQYAIAIDEFERKNHALPVSLTQLKEARRPRLLRGPKAEYADPLTGQVDWLIVPQQAAGAAAPPAAGPTPGAGPTGQTQPTIIPAIPMKDYAGGPFIGVRPDKKGNSFLQLNGAQNYEEWSYTVIDYRNERNALWAAALKTWR